jgi:hypothetical protein
MGCDSIVNVIRTVRIQKLLLVRLVCNCATNHACVSKSNKVLMLGRTDVFSHLTPESRSPLYLATKAPRRADIHQKSMRTELSSIIYSFPALEIPPNIWMQAWLRSLQVNLALRRDPIMIQCTLSSRETDCMACSHAPPELPAQSMFQPENGRIEKLMVPSESAPQELSNEWAISVSRPSWPKSPSVIKELKV